MKKILLLQIAAMFFTGFIYSQDKAADEGILFHFDHKKGTATSHVAEVEEEAYLNDILSNRTQFINRITTTVVDELENGDGVLQTNYMTTQNTIMLGYDNYLTWGDESTVNINRKSNGQLYNSDTEDLPTVRGVPSFPDYPVKPGDTWTMEGEEVHDCRELFRMTELIRVPFTAYYKYAGPVEINGKRYEEINVQYEFHQYNKDNRGKRIYKNGSFAGVDGYAAQIIYWDTEKNDLEHYEEEFHIEMFDYYGNSYYFQGISGGDVTEYKSLNNDLEIEKIKDTVKEYDLKDVSVTKGEKGLTISLENIQFEPDSDILLLSEQEKLQKLGEILKSVPNDLLVTGHCADRGTVGAQQSLSESRAEAVADFLVSEGVRDKYHIFTQGKGAREPVASNKTEQGRAKNRRVEITIMD